MQEIIERREPSPGSYGTWPDWCSVKALKMVVKEFDQKHRYCIIGNNAVVVLITPNGEKEWYVDWFFLGTKPNRILFSSDELRAAFGLTSEVGKTGMEILHRLGGDSAEEGKYLRWKEWLNIPSVPADFQTDASVSIEIDDEMRNCIRCLVDN